MRRFIMLAAVSIACACGQPATSASADSAPPPPALDEMQGGGEGGGAVMESQADFIARCTRELIAANPESRRWAGDQCTQTWETVVAAGPMAEAILAAVPRTGETVQAQTMRTRVTAVRWAARPQGTLIAQGSLGNLDVQVEQARIAFYWGATGEMIPYDVVQALNGRGAEVTMIGCSQMGVGEMNQSYRVNAAGRAPFALSVYARTAPTANAESFYNVSADLTGQVPTLALLRRDGSDWAARCPY